MSSVAEKTVCLLALGGNVGDVAATFGRALDLLAEQQISVMKISKLYRTLPRGPREELLHDRTLSSFINAACCVRTPHTPAALLAITQQIEQLCGRLPAPRPLSRTLDIDLIDCRPRISTSSLLELPHPRAHLRRFVLQPLVDIAPSWPLGRKGETAQELLLALAQDPLFPMGFSDEALEARVLVQHPRFAKNLR